MEFGTIDEEGNELNVFGPGEDGSVTIHNSCGAPMLFDITIEEKELQSGRRVFIISSNYGENICSFDGKKFKVLK